MVYAVVGGGLDTEPVIRLFGRKGLDTNTGTSTLQDARLLCDKRMVYAAVGGDLDAEPAIGLSRSEGPRYKSGHSDFVGCPFAMRQAQGLCYGRREDRR